MYSIGPPPNISVLPLSGTLGFIVPYSTPSNATQALLITYIYGGLQSTVTTGLQVGGPLNATVKIKTCSDCDTETGCGPCTTNSNLNVSVWITNTIAGNPAEQSVRLASFDLMGLRNEAECVTPFELGCATLEFPHSLAIADNADINVSLPVQVSCTGNYYLGLYLRAVARHTDAPCGTTIVGPFSCRNPPTSITFTGGSSGDCVYSRTGYAFWTLYLAKQDAYENAYAGATLEETASFFRDYNFSCPKPSTTVSIIPGNATTAIVGDISATIPSNVIPDNINSSLYLEVLEKANGSGTKIARVYVQQSNGSIYKLRNLSVPLNVSFPLEVTDCKTPVCHFWNVSRSAWDTSGCATLHDTAAGAYICSCNHATDFSMLLLESQQSCETSLMSPASEIFFAFAAVYIVIGVVSLGYAFVNFLLVREGKGHRGMLMQHAGVFLVCALRTWLSLYETGDIGVTSTLQIAAITAIPRLIEFFLFSYIITRWGAILHFTMNADPFAKVKPFFIGLNVCAVGIVIYIFIAFGINPTYDSAILGESLLTAVGCLLAGGFFFYATWFNKQFASAQPAGSKQCFAQRLVWVGWLFAFSFILQGVFACSALLAIPRDPSSVTDLSTIQMELTLYNSLYRVFDLVTLVCILVLYHDGVRRLHDRARSSRPSSHIASSTAQTSAYPASSLSSSD